MIARWALLAAVTAIVAVVAAGDVERDRANATSCPSPAPASVMHLLGPPDRVAQIREQHLPNVELTTQDGRSVRFYDDLVKGKVVAINFMYANCKGSCPLSTQHLASAQRALGERAGRDVTFLSISLDPDHDTPQVLRAYAEAHDAGPGWYFLTGRLDDIERLRRSLGVYDLDPIVDADRTQHSGLVILGNEPKGRWKAVPALVDPVRIRQAIERTLLPPSQWPTGAAVVNEVPYQESLADARPVTPADLRALPARE